MDIYKITNLVNGKIYVGKSTDYKRRFTDHLYNASKGHQSFLYSAIRKYGADQFQVNLIESVETEDQANEREQYGIKLGDTTNPKVGYNLTEGGDGGNTLRFLSVEQLVMRQQKIQQTVAAWTEEECQLHHQHRLEGYQKKLQRGFIPSSPSQGKHGYNNGVKNIMRESCPEGYFEGRLKTEKSLNGVKAMQQVHLKGFNNGEVEVKAAECPEGYVRGKLKRVRDHRAVSAETRAKISHTVKQLGQDEAYRQHRSLKHRQGGQSRTMSSEEGQRHHDSQVGRIVVHRGDRERRIYPDEGEAFEREGGQRGKSQKHRENSRKKRG